MTCLVREPHCILYAALKVFCIYGCGRPHKRTREWKDTHPPRSVRIQLRIPIYDVTAQG